MSTPLYLARDDFDHFGHSFVIGMDAVRLHLVAVVSEEGMEVDDFQAVFLGYLLLNGDDVVDNDGVVDVPRRLEGRNRRAKEDLRCDGSHLFSFLPLFLVFGRCIEAGA